MRISKTRILDAADEIFVSRGIDGARMQEIADQAGVNKALLGFPTRLEVHPFRRSVQVRRSGANKKRI